MLSAAVLCLCLSAGDGELADWLERAGSSDWAERERAQRWLATHLEPLDAPALAARASRGDAEVRARLARAIGGEPRLLELAALLALRPEPAALELGREALREQLLEWDPGAESPASESLDWLVELRQAFPERLSLPAEPRAGAPAAILDLAARAVRGAPALVLDPAAASRASAGAGELQGTLAELLLQCAAERGLRVLGFGFGPEAEGPPWILLAPPGASSETAAERIAGWVLAAVEPARAAGERAAAACALAATGWPSALALLESRWLQGDEPALAGLLLAAGRGRVAPALQDPARQRVLYASLRALAADEHDRPALSRASSIARALARAGPLSRAGEPLGPLALEGFERASAREQWLRLAVLEGQGRAFPAALAAADGVLAAPTSPAPLAVQALRLHAALAGATVRTPPPANPLALLDWAADPRSRAELRALWTGLELGWPAQWNGLEARGLLLELAWSAGARDAALVHARALFAERSAPAFDALVAALARPGGRALAELLPAGSPSEAAHATAAALLAGLEPSARDEALLARWLSEGPQTGEELLALASQAAGARGAQVRERLVERLGAPLPLEQRLEALERAARELSEHGAEAELESLASAARARARTLGDTELRARLRPGRWPRPPSGPARDLGIDERELERW